MTTTNPTILACDGLGTQPTLSKLPCCHVTDQDSPTCNRLFPTALKQGLLGKACLGSGSTCPLFTNCSDVSSLYSSLEQTEQRGDGSWLIKRYAACANMPTIAMAAYAGDLSRGISDVVGGYIPPLQQLKLNGFETKLQVITSAVTDCLSSTCRASRDVDFCYENHCAPARLLRNGTLPNLEGINDCMWTLCNADERALPWPDADVIGIGVFISYMMQCALVVLLWAGLLFFAIKQSRRTKSRSRSESSPNQTTSECNEQASPHFDALLSLLLDFYKSQCYFAGTLMLASAITIFSARASGSKGVDIVITFLIIPLATNSILPVVFAYLLLLYFTQLKSIQRSGVSPPITILTTTVYLLSSVIFWVLYSDLPLQSRPGSSTEAGRVDDPSDMYRLYRLQLSSLPACGGYSGLAVCPFDSRQRATAVKEGLDARKKLRVLTPIIWGWSTFVLLGCLGWLFLRSSGPFLWRGKSAGRRHEVMRMNGSSLGEKTVTVKENDSRWKTVVHRLEGSSWWMAGFWFATVVFLADVGMQLAVLWTAKLLGMVNDSDWGFGQIVAVTIWIPPLLEYLFEEIELLAKEFYGYSIDTLGNVIESISGLRLDDYIEHNIFRPLGIKDSGLITPEIHTHRRSPNGVITSTPPVPVNKTTATPGGGGYLISTLDDYSTFLLTLLNWGTHPQSGVTILKSSTIKKHVFADLIPASLDPSLCALSQKKPNGDAVGVWNSNNQTMSLSAEFLPGTPKGWSASFLTNNEDIKGRRKAGSGAWVGINNLFYWVDIKNGKLGVVFTNLQPFLDPEVLALFDKLEEFVYAS